MEHRTRIVAPIFDQGTDYAFTFSYLYKGSWEANGPKTFRRLSAICQ
jgi:hypothetical protein